MDGMIRKMHVAMIPPSLRAGDRVAIVSPASSIDPGLIDGAARMLAQEGYEPVVMPHAKGKCGSFSATASERLADMMSALEDDSIRAVLCSRGGYGAVHLLEELDALPAGCFNKWLVGFSDITALHCLWIRKGVASLHGAMAKYLMRGNDFQYYAREMGILSGAGDKMRRYAFKGHAYNFKGECTGRVVGGNLAVLGGLVGTPFDPVGAGDILFIEDIAEPIYKVERILWQLRLRGVFDRIGGLMVGAFTEYRPSADHPDMETMINRFMGAYDFPRAYGIPSGHIEENSPLILGSEATLAVGDSSVDLRYD